MSLLRRIRVLLLCGIAAAASARPVRVTLWISGGADGVLMGGGDAPGFLGLAAHVADRAADGCWIDAGGTRDWPLLRRIGNLRLPDAVAPGEDLLRAEGLDVFDWEAPWTLLNAGALPQFPDWEPSVPPERIWRTPDGAAVRVWGLLSDRAPLRIPPPRLRPLRVTPALDAVREKLLASGASGALTVLVLPEGADPAAWSDAVPDVPVLVEPASARPEVIPLDGGARLRVRPARHGRALVRVWADWDTVERRFGPPRAEIEWVRTPNLERWTLPEEAVARLRAVETDEPAEPSDLDVDPRSAARERADVVLWPEFNGEDTLSRWPDGLRAAAVPRDHAWVRVTVPADEARRWMEIPVPGMTWLADARGLSGKVEVLLPARAAAGAGGGAWPLWRALEADAFEMEWLETSTRDWAWASGGEGE